MSSVVLDSYQELLRDHLVVTLFLTMLVGGASTPAALWLLWLPCVLGIVQ